MNASSRLIPCGLWRISLGLLVLLGAGPAGPSAEEPVPLPRSADNPIQLAYDPAETLKAVVRRLLGPEAGSPPFRTGELQIRSDVGGQWLKEVFAPLSAPECRPILEHFHIPLPGNAGAALPAVWLDDRPIAAVTGKELVLPVRLGRSAPGERERLEQTGLFDFEVALTGELVRLQGVGRSGDSPADPLLRLSRAARLEGAARIVAAALMAQGAKVDPQAMGAGLLALDQGLAGIPGPFLEAAASDSLRRALIVTFVEDGRRWALFQFLRGGASAMAAALRQPVSIDGLISPGLAPDAPPPVREGCSLGPRGASALLAGTDDPAWVNNLIGDRWNLAENGQISVRLLFRNPGAAEQASADLSRNGLSWRQNGVFLESRIPLPAPSKK